MPQEDPWRIQTLRHAVHLYNDTRNWWELRRVVRELLLPGDPVREQLLNLHQDRDGTLLACVLWYNELLEKLLRAGLDPDTVVSNRCGSTLLHVAARHGKLHVIRMLRDYGANPRFLDRSGRTPLQWISPHRPEAARALLEAALISPGTTSSAN